MQAAGGLQCTSGLSPGGTAGDSAVCTVVVDCMHLQNYACCCPHLCNTRHVHALNAGHRTSSARWLLVLGADGSLLLCVRALCQHVADSLRLR